MTLTLETFKLICSKYKVANPITVTQSNLISVIPNYYMFNYHLPNPTPHSCLYLSPAFRHKSSE